MKNTAAILILCLFTSLLSAQCIFNDLTIEPDFCELDENSLSYNATIDFNYDGVSNEFFDLYVDDELYGLYPFADLPIIINIPYVSGTLVNTITICENDNPECCIMEDILTPCFCNIQNVQVDILECNESIGQFYIGIDVLFIDTIGEYTVGGNGNNYGDFLASDFPLLLGPFNLDSSFYEILVADNQDPFCLNGAELGFVESCPPCELQDIIIEAQACNDEGARFIDFSVTNPNPNPEGFTVFANGQDFGSYNYGQDFYTIGPISFACEDSLSLRIEDNLYPSCIEGAILFEELCCEMEEDCQNLRDLTVSALCMDNIVIGISVDFLYDGDANDMFDVYIQDVYLGSTSYSNLPVSYFNIPELTSNNPLVNIVLNENCVLSEDYILACAIPECSLYDLFVEAYDCDGESFYFDFEFNTLGDIGESFEARGNGVSYGIFEYGETFYTVGPIPINCNQDYELVIIDQTYGDCFTDTGFATPECCNQQDCELDILEVRDIVCNENDNILNLIVEVSEQNSSQSGFDIYINDNFLFYLDNNDNSSFGININAVDLNETFILSLCANDVDNCCDSILVENVCFEPEPICHWENISLQANPCNDDGQFYALMEINLANQVLSDSFTVVGNGESYGEFSYENNVIEIGPLLGDCEQIYEFIFTDSAFPDCQYEVFFEEAICCQIDECNLSDLLIEAYDCNEDSFFIDIEFNYAGKGNDGFSILGNGNNYGSFDYGEDFYTLGPLEYDCNTELEFIIVDNQFENCSIATGVENFVCCESNCSIQNLFAESYDCDGNAFYVDIEFSHENTGDEGFEIRGNGMSYGIFEYGLDFYTVGPIVLNCDLIYEFIIIDNDNPDCRAAIGIEDQLTCCNDECDIDITSILNLDCDLSTGIIETSLFLTYENIPNDGYDIFIDDEFFQFYNEVNDSIINLEISAENLGQVFQVTICVNDNEECCTSTTLDNLCNDVAPLCHWESIDLSHTECEEDVFFVDINYNVASELLSDSFYILGNGTEYGTFSYDENPISLGPFNGDCETIYEFVLIDQNVDDCRIDGFFEEPICCNEGGECMMEITEYNIDCVDDTFYISMIVEGENIPEEVRISGNGTFYGDFNFGETITIGPLPADNETVYEFIAFDSNNDACNDVIELGLINCTTSTLDLDFNTDIYFGNSILFIDNSSPIEDIQIINIEGKTVYKNMEVNHKNMSIQSQNWTSGMYVISLKSNNKVKSFKVLVTN